MDSIFYGGIVTPCHDKGTKTMTLTRPQIAIVLALTDEWKTYHDLYRELRFFCGIVPWGGTGDIIEHGYCPCEHCGCNPLACRLTPAGMRLKRRLIREGWYLG